MALTNNDIIKKLRVALQLKDDDIIEILKLVDYQISKSELGAFFRHESHVKFMPLQDQILRNFLNGLVIYKRGPMERKPPSTPKAKQELPKSESKSKKVEEEPKRNRPKRLRMTIERRKPKS
jgi:hypothetical protein